MVAKWARLDGPARQNGAGSVEIFNSPVRFGSVRLVRQTDRSKANQPSIFHWFIFIFYFLN